MTHHELALIDFINDYRDRHRVSPSFAEMQEALGLKSKSGISRYLGRLVDKGLMVRMPLADRNYRPPTIDLSVVPTLDLRAELERRNPNMQEIS